MSLLFLQQLFVLSGPFVQEGVVRIVLPFYELGAQVVQFDCGSHRDLISHNLLFDRYKGRYIIFRFAMSAFISPFFFRHNFHIWS